MLKINPLILIGIINIVHMSFDNEGFIKGLELNNEYLKGK
jgi:hypothetical protein